MPNRGKTNSPEFVIYTVNEIANVLNQDKDMVAKKLFNNAINVFNL
ncbi:hypothetical protein FACS1894218_1920 [Bacilli bacterium]|nr:hypothetical protein FACS1894218_1920 [Bacilli bacterium]